MWWWLSLLITKSFITLWSILVVLARTSPHLHFFTDMYPWFVPSFLVPKPWQVVFLKLLSSQLSCIYSSFGRHVSSNSSYPLDAVSLHVCLDQDVYTSYTWEGARSFLLDFISIVKLIYSMGRWGDTKAILKHNYISAFSLIHDCNWSNATPTKFSSCNGQGNLPSVCTKKSLYITRH